MEPTKETYAELDRAYAYFNRELFGGALPACLLTMQRHRKAYGYFWGGTWSDAGGHAIADEIALNPDHFRSRPLPNSLATLVHEMCHLQQHHFGKPSRPGYHNREWAAFMEAVGLVPSDTGLPGGKKTGQTVSHFIAPGGRFEVACTALLQSGFVLPWLALTNSDEETQKKKAASKTRYTCPACGLNVWGKPEIHIICGECRERMKTEGLSGL